MGIIRQEDSAPQDDDLFRQCVNDNSTLEDIDAEKFGAKRRLNYHFPRTSCNAGAFRPAGQLSSRAGA
jgi:hypothetical protein